MKKLKSICLLAGFSCLFLNTLNVNSAEAARIQYTTTLTKNFQGVRSCGTRSRQNQEARNAVKKFLRSRRSRAYAKSWRIIHRRSRQTIRLRKRKCYGTVKVQLRYSVSRRKPSDVSYYTTLTKNFKGVRSCGTSSRQNQEARNAVKEFLRSRRSRAYAKGWEITRRWSRQSSSSFGKRKCYGMVKVRLRYALSR